jgi:hypothetical protein
MNIILGSLLFIIGIYILYLNIKNITLVCDKKIEYRYVPRTLQEEMKEPVKATVIFQKMFSDITPYSISSDNFYERR